MNTKAIAPTSPVAKLAVFVMAAAVALVLAFAMAPADQALAAPAKQAPAKGSTFVVDGNTYKVTDRYKNSRDLGEVVLVKYGSKNTAPSINTVKYQNGIYEVEAIGRSAFNTAKGRAITSVKLGRNVEEVGAMAFQGCSKLRTIDIAQSDIIELDYSRRTKSYYVDDVEIGAFAFAKAGVKNVTVKCGSANKSYQTAVKKALTGKGLRTTASVVR